jgi:hypothetical protein
LTVVVADTDRPELPFCSPEEAGARPIRGIALQQSFSSVLFAESTLVTLARMAARGTLGILLPARDGGR